MGLHTESNTEVVTGTFPLCWEMEVMDNGSAEDDENVDGGDVYTRCVPIAISCAARALMSLDQFLASGCLVPRCSLALGEVTPERR